jgi:hypothetical protein
MRNTQQELEWLVTTHLSCRKKLYLFLSDQDEVDHIHIQRHLSCPLEKWIQDKGQALLSNEEYQTVEGFHAKFREAASVFVQKKIAGDAVGAKQMMALQGPVSTTSCQLTAYLTKLIAKRYNNSNSALSPSAN